MDSSGGPSRKVLLSLFWALQGSLLSWCFLQLKGGAVIACDLARDILIKCKPKLNEAFSYLEMVKFYKLQDSQIIPPSELSSLLKKK